jgi:hypothetical protein
VVSFPPVILSPWRGPWHPLDRKFCGPKAILADMEKRKLKTLPALKLQPLGSPTASHYTDCATAARYVKGKTGITNRKTTQAMPHPTWLATDFPLQWSRFHAMSSHVGVVTMASRHVSTEHLFLLTILIPQMIHTYLSPRAGSKPINHNCTKQTPSSTSTAKTTNQPL